MQVIAHRCLPETEKGAPCYGPFLAKKSSAVSAAEGLGLSSYRVTSPFCEAPIFGLVAATILVVTRECQRITRRVLQF
jgi:hypothetical protein